MNKSSTEKFGIKINKSTYNENINKLFEKTMKHKQILGDIIQKQREKYLNDMKPDRKTFEKASVLYDTSYNCYDRGKKGDFSPSNFLLSNRTYKKSKSDKNLGYK